MRKITCTHLLPLLLPLLLLLFSSPNVASAQDLLPDDQSQDQPDAQENTVVDVINDSDDHETFSELISEAEMEDFLNQPGPYTVLAPTDEAFEEFQSDLDAFRQNTDQLREFLINHLYQGTSTSSEIESTMDVQIVEGDMSASNGVVHSIDNVIN